VIDNEVGVPSFLFDRRKLGGLDRSPRLLVSESVKESVEGGVREKYLLVI